MIWRLGNLLLIQVVGGNNITLNDASRWIQLVRANAEALGIPDTAAPTWINYTHPKLGYSFWYPASWFDLGNLGVDTLAYFSDEKIGAPLQLDALGVWLTVSATDGACPKPAATPGPLDRQLRVSGQLVWRTAGHIGAPRGEGGWAIGADVPRGEKCIGLHFLTMSPDAQAAHLNTVDEIVASFR